MRRLCLVTGASAGIGAELARVFAERGYDLALTARRADRLEALKAEIEGRWGNRCHTVAADLAAPGAVDAILTALADRGCQVDALVNNAGYGLPGTFQATSWTDQAAFIQVLLAAPTELAHKLVGGMAQRRFGRIINVASLAGHLPGSAGHTLYAAVKAYMVKFSQSLHLETKGQGVHVSALCPGFTYSEFHDVNGTRAQVSQMPAWLWQTGAEVARLGFEAVERNKPVEVTGPANKAIAALAKLLPDPVALKIVAGQSSRFRRLDQGVRDE